MTHREEFRKRKEAAKAKHEATGEYTSAGPTAATKAVAAGDVTGGGMSPGFAAKFQQAQAEQVSLPTQQQPLQTAQPQDEGGIWNWLKDKYYNAVGSAQGGIDPRTEAQITGEQMKGASMIELLGLGAAASAPMLVAKGLAAGMKLQLHLTKQTATHFKRTGEIIISTANPKTWKLTTKTLIGLGITAYIAEKAYSSIVFGKFQLAEASDKLGFAKAELIRKGIWNVNNLQVEGSIEKEINDSMENITNLDLWDKIKINTPWISAQIGTLTNLKAANISTKAWDYIASKLQEQKDKGEDFATTYLKMKEDARAMEEQWRLDDAEYWKQIQQNIKDAKREAREEDKKYWDQIFAEREERRREEREEMEAYWEAVRKNWAKLQDANRKSNLVFGLLG